MLETKKPLFGICLGHQMLALAVGGKTSKMFQGHRGANHPVKRLADGRVEITSMNHGFAVEREGMPDNVRETHVSLFDGSNCGIELTDRPAFSVQYHPEASPGPQDSFYLFEKFVGAMRVRTTASILHIDAALLSRLRDSGADRMRGAAQQVALGSGLALGELIAGREREAWLPRLSDSDPTSKHRLMRRQWARSNGSKPSSATCSCRDDRV